MKEEWFDLVDPDGTVIGHAPRSLCHTHPGLLHQAVHVLVFNRGGELFLQKRSPRKDVQPGKWDTSVGGHVGPGEARESAARRELQEELGIAGVELTPAYSYRWTSEIESEIITAFAIEYDGPVRIDPNEISEGRYWPLAEIAARLDDGGFTPQFVQEFPRMLAWRRRHANEVNA